MSNQPVGNNNFTTFVTGWSNFVSNDSIVYEDNKFEIFFKSNLSSYKILKIHACCPNKTCHTPF